MSRRRRKADPADLAAEPGPEDGQDPKEFHARPWDAPKQAGRKARQLCGQVRDALHLALAGCGDGVLQAVGVVSVEPAPHTGRLRVVCAVPADGRVSRAVAEDHLRRAAGMLRAEVAAAIHRRYAPELAFDVIG
jgi:ribosome-binding factor A